MVVRDNEKNCFCPKEKMDRGFNPDVVANIGVFIDALVFLHSIKDEPNYRPYEILKKVGEETGDDEQTRQHQFMRDGKSPGSICLEYPENS